MMQEQKEIPLEIIIVDDSDFARETLSEILEKAGHKVVAHVDGADKAIEISKNTSANLFIIDVVMPNKSGIEACEKILEVNPNVAVIMTSSLRGESILIDSIASGAIDFLQKPFNKEDLLKACLRAKTILSKG